MTNSEASTLNMFSLCSSNSFPLSVSFVQSEDEKIIRYLLQNAQSLEKLRLSVDCRWNLVGLLSPSGRTGTLIKVLDLTVCYESEKFIGSVIQNVEEVLAALHGLP